MFLFFKGVKDIILIYNLFELCSSVPIWSTSNACMHICMYVCTVMYACMYISHFI